MMDFEVWVIEKWDRKKDRCSNVTYVNVSAETPDEAITLVKSLGLPNGKDFRIGKVTIPNEAEIIRKQAVDENLRKQREALEEYNRRAAI